MHRSPLVHVIALLPFLLPHVSGTAPVTLVEDGKSAYTIYVAPDAVGSVSRAAQELRRVIQVSTGVALPIGHTPTEAMICLGDNAAARGAGIKVTDMLPESFRFLTRGDSVFIAGPDTPPPPTIHDPASRGTLTGVYAFLEKIVGARWLMPGEIGEDIPAQERLDVPDLDEQHSPTFRIRALSYVQEREHASVREWLVRNRVGRSRFLAVSHSWDDHPPRDLVMKHPEWWPKQGGERRRPEDAHKSVQKYCTTNQDYVHAFAASMAKRLDGWGTAGYQRNMASASPSDGSGWCECSACKQGWEATDDHPLTGPKLYRHSLTPTILTFYNGIREALNTHHPDAWVGGFVYAAYTYPPREPIQLADRIFLMMAPRVNYGLTMYRPEYRDEFEPFLASWRAVTPHLGYYAVDTWMRSVLGTPLPASRPILRPMYPLLRKHGVSAVLHYGLAAWGYGAPHNYLVARLMWDADADIDAVYEEFFRRAYGKGDAPMMAIYDLLERELGRFEQQEKG
ncbi:MAG: DUF4838 domain-containing protein, partial [Lentisphaerae bacterium]|nr:DUF4838 domain-containing protein [Lentisphaerota bacterium]